MTLHDRHPLLLTGFFSALGTVLVFFAPGCSGSPPAGTERAACYPNGTCNAGLSCLSQVCVKADGQSPPAPTPTPVAAETHPIPLCAQALNQAKTCLLGLPADLKPKLAALPPERRKRKEVRYFLDPAAAMAEFRAEIDKVSDPVKECQEALDETSAGECADLYAKIRRRLEEDPDGHAEKIAEARTHLQKLYSGVRAYWMDQARGQHPGLWSMNNPGKPMLGFPEPSTEWTPPLGECCKQGGRCNPHPDWWDKRDENGERTAATQAFYAAKFSMDDPHYYSYKYEVHNSPGGLGSEFRVFASGDLDCDGVYSTFSLYGVVNDEFADGPTGSPPLDRTAELE
jgi:hypothetical protein